MAENNKQLLPCPFCGAPGEIYTGRSYPNATKTFHAEAEALEWVKNNVQPDSTTSGVYHDTLAMRYPNKAYSRGTWVAWYDRPGYIARCTTPSCIARSTVKHKTEQEAIETWNGRAEHGKG